MFETKENILTKLFEKLKDYAENYQLTNPLEFHSWCKNLYLRDLGFQTRSFLIEDFDGVYDIYICQMTNKMEIQIKFYNFFITFITKNYFFFLDFNLVFSFRNFILFSQLYLTAKSNIFSLSLFK